MAVNRLINEKSPYLKQHAENPVDWYPWGQEALTRAKIENKPIFLSIGYSTCHWCHVMAKDSFEDPDVADVLNKYFISIKVDREERPDLDDIYMRTCQMMTGSGGWPLTIIMTPDKKPFFAATFISKEPRYGSPGIIDLLEGISNLWAIKHDDIVKKSDEVVSYLNNISKSDSKGKLSEDLLLRAFNQLKEIYDPEYGGFNVPKFPTAHLITFLIKYWKKTGNEEALFMAKNTLDKMKMGGIYDHVGYGFHRYAIDDAWMIPHFEKMLYDQALISMAYLESYRATRNEEHKKIVSEIFDYVLNIMKSPENGFYSAENAESEGIEGKFYLWTSDEIDHILTDKENKIFKMAYGIKDEGNYLEEATGRSNGTNILYMERPIQEIASELEMWPEEAEQILEKARKKLLTVREMRIRPSKDYKILADWNGLMIASLAKSGRIFKNESYIKASEDAVSFIFQNMVKNDQVYHSYIDGEIKIPGFLDDYSFVIWGLLELYFATFNVKYLNKAQILTEKTLELFWEDGGFNFTSNEVTDNILKVRNIYDGAMPSGTSIMALNMLRLFHILRINKYHEKTYELFENSAEKISKSPFTYLQMLSAFYFDLEPTDISIVGDLKDKKTEEVLDEINRVYRPNTSMLFVPSDSEGLHNLEKIASFVKEYPKSKEPVVYVCKKDFCLPPETNLSQIHNLLK